MIDVNQLRRGVTFIHDGALLKVNEYSHSKPGRGKATIRVRVRDLRTGTNKEVTFSSGDRVEVVVRKPRLVCPEPACDRRTFTPATDQLPAASARVGWRSPTPSPATA